MAAATVYLPCIADTTLIQTAPSNNLGAAEFVNAGTTQNSNYNRGLFKFDLTGIPRGSRILAGRVVLNVTREPKDGFAASPFSLHRVLVSWAEGDKISPVISPGQGQPASTNEATWNNRFAFTTNSWAEPGGLAGIDFATNASSLEFIYGIADSPYTFGSTPTLVDDIRFWLANPDQNFGWLLKTDVETAIFTARRFASREDPDEYPVLEVDLVPPPIVQVESVSTNILSFSFQAEAGRPYSVQAETILAPGLWTTLTNVPPQSADTTILISDSTPGNQRFYRVVAP